MQRAEQMDGKEPCLLLPRVIIHGVLSMVWWGGAEGCRPPKRMFSCPEVFGATSVSFQANLEGSDPSLLGFLPQGGTLEERASHNLHGVFWPPHQSLAVIPLPSEWTPRNTASL